MKKQAGVIELSMITMLVLFVGLVVVFMRFEASRRLTSEAERGAEVFKQVVAASMAYRQDVGAFPANINQLVPAYLSAAGVTMPWGSAVTVAQSGGNNVVISTSSTDVGIRGMMARAIPLATVSGNTVTATYGKPGTEPALASLLHRDGSQPLSANWDVGGYSVANVNDMTFTGLDNRTVMGGLTYTSIQNNQDGVSKITCPSGRNAKVFVTPVSWSNNGSPFDGMGSVEARYDDYGTWVRVYLRVWAKLSNGSYNWIVPNSNAARVKVDMKCDK